MQSAEFDIKRADFDVLSLEEELKLGKRIQENGDIEAQHKLIKANIRFVYYIIKKNYRVTASRLTFEDMVGEGMLGLAEAAKRYSHEYGCRFSAYARHWIQKMLNKYIYSQATAVHVPITKIRTIHRLHRLAEELSKKEQREIREEDLAEQLGVDHLAVSSVKGAFQSSEIEDPEHIESEEIDSEFFTMGIPLNVIEKALEGLPNLEKDIVCRYYGINCPTQTLQEIGVIYALSRERIRQLKKESLEVMRDKIDNAQLGRSLTGKTQGFGP